MLSPKEIVNNYASIAKYKTSLPWHKTLILAILAGIFIGLGALVSTIATSFGGSRLIMGLVFPVGLIMVTLFGAELFTGNCLMISPLIAKEIKPSGFFKNLSIVYIGNFIGSLLLAVLVVYGGVLNIGENVVTNTIGIATMKATLPFLDSFVKGVLCNILVCLAVLGSTVSKTTVGKFAAIFVPIFVFVVAGFEHSVANMYYLSVGLLAGVNAGKATFTVSDAIVNSLIPSTLGNIIGGFAIALTLHFVYKTTQKSTATQEAEQPINEKVGEIAEAVNAEITADEAETSENGENK